jgi:hypothetical protein
MSHRLPLLNAIRRPLVWLLALAVVVYGPSATLVGMLGPAHVHVSSVGDIALVRQVADGFRDLRAWRAELRHRLLASDHAHGEQGHAGPAHAHAHDGWQRHHHEPHDRSVLALDDGAGHDGANPSASGSAMLPLALAPGHAVPASTDPARAWGAVTAARWSDAPQHLVHPPPRA